MLSPKSQQAKLVAYFHIWLDAMVFINKVLLVCTEKLYLIVLKSANDI